MTSAPLDQALVDQALVEEASKKSGLVWARGTVPAERDRPERDRPERDRPGQALWHVWHDGAVCVVGDGPGEQPLPDLVDGRGALVTVRSKDKGGRLVTWPAKVVELAPESPEWEAAVAELKGKRLNAPDAETMPRRWARECRVLRLEPAGAAAELPADSGAAPPVPTPAVTRRPVPEALPRLLWKRKRRR